MYAGCSFCDIGVLLFWYCCDIGLLCACAWFVIVCLVVVVMCDVCVIVVLLSLIGSVIGVLLVYL